jgi:hypothetical protein
LRTAIETASFSERGAAGRLAHARHHVLALGVDGDIGAKLARQRELLRVAAEAGDDDLPGAGGPGGDDAAEPALPRAQDDDPIAHLRARDRARPREAGGEGIEHDGDARRDPRIHLLQDGVGAQVHVLGIAAPEGRRLADIGVAVGAAAPGTEARLPARAGLAAAAAVPDRTATRSPSATPQRARARAPISSMTPSGS